MSVLSKCVIPVLETSQKEKYYSLLSDVVLNIHYGTSMFLRRILKPVKDCCMNAQTRNTHFLSNSQA